MTIQPEVIVLKAAVVDASVAVKWVIEEDNTDKALRLLDCEALHAPDHWLAEAVNAVWAKVLRRQITAFNAEQRAEGLTRFPILAVPVLGLIRSAFALSVAHSITIYDSLYLALAEKLDLPLITADAALIRCLARDPKLSGRVISVADL